MELLQAMEGMLSQLLVMVYSKINFIGLFKILGENIGVIIPPEQVTPVEIDVNFEKSGLDCNLAVNTNSSLNNWKNTLDVKFSHEDGTSNLFFQIGKNKILGKDVISSNVEIYKTYYHLKKGKYIYNGFESLGVENTFKLNDFQGKSFDLYGRDTISPLISSQNQYYISQIGSKMVFIHEYGANDNSLPPIYKNLFYNYPMNNCHHIKTSTKLDNEMGYCEITKEDLTYIESKGPVKVYFQVLCGYFSDSSIMLNKLNTEIYPVFEVFKFLKPVDEILTKESDLIIVANNSGNSHYFMNEENNFYGIMEIEYNNKNKSALAYCWAQVNYENTESNLTYKLKIKDDVYPYDNLYLLPYSYLDKINTPFEVVIKKTIKAEVGPEPEPTDLEPTAEPTDPEPTDTEKPISPSPTKSSYLEYSLKLLIGLKLLLF